MYCMVESKVKFLQRYQMNCQDSREQQIEKVSPKSVNARGKLKIKMINKYPLAMRKICLK